MTNIDTLFDNFKTIKCVKNNSINKNTYWWIWLWYTTVTDSVLLLYCFDVIAKAVFDLLIGALVYSANVADDINKND